MGKCRDQKRFRIAQKRLKIIIEMHIFPRLFLHFLGNQRGAKNLKKGTRTNLMGRGVLGLVLDLGAEDSEDIGFEGRFGNWLGSKGPGLEEKS